MTSSPVETRSDPRETRQELSDAELFDLHARRLSTPRAGITDSFKLHAPLELMARHALLQYVEPERRPDVRYRMGAIANTFELSGPPIASPVADVAHQLQDLGRAIAIGDRDGADLWMSAVAPRLSIDDLVAAIADEVLSRLAGAAHGSILLHLLLRVAPRSQDATQLGRGLVAELAGDPDSRIEWISRRSEVSPGSRNDGDSLLAALASVDSAGDPGSDFIAPTMSLVDRSGMAAEVLTGPTAGLSVCNARQVLLRTAAHSMLQDDPRRAPYGWTHCLTMPQGTLDIARFCSRPDDAVAVASTYVLGFRATLSNTSIDPDWQPARSRADSVTDPGELLENGPRHAAATAWHAEPEHRPVLVQHLAGFAATHHDAHLAKYTLACFDAARDDPAASHLYLSAAASLAAWWHDRDA